jgi:hypothetical protein
VLLLLSALAPRPAPAQAPPDTLRIVGSTDADAITLERPGAEFRYAFQVEAAGPTGADSLQVFVAPFVSAHGARVTPRWQIAGRPGENAWVPVPGLGSIEVEIVASLPEPGVYSSSVSLVYGGQRRTRPLIVNRTRAAPSLSLVDLGAVRAQLRWFRPVTVRAAVQDTAGQPVWIYPPTLVALARNEGDAARVQAHFDRVEVVDEFGYRQGSSQLMLPAGATRHFRLSIHGLRDPGQYTGTLQLSGSAFRPISQSVTISVRESAWTAGFIVFLGVLLSFLLRTYASTGRPRILRRHRIAGLLADVDALERELGDATEHEREVLARLRQRLDAIYEGTELGTDAQADAQLDEIAPKVGEFFPAWVTARRHVEAAAPPADLREQFLARLRTAGQYLLASPVTQEQTAAATQNLQNLAADVAAAVRTELLERIAAFEAQVAAERQDRASDESLLRVIEAEVEKRIREARGLAEAGDHGRARARFDEARGLYARVLARDLAARVRGEVPAGVAPDDWRTLQAQVAQDLDKVEAAADPEAANAAYGAAFASYLRVLLGAMQRQAEQGALRVGARPDLEDDEKDRLAARFEAIRDQAAEATRRLALRQWTEAAADYRGAAQALAALEKELARKGEQMGVLSRIFAAASATQGTIPPAAGRADAEPVAGRPVRPRASAAELTRRLGIGDLLSNLVILLVAVLLGLQLLWVTNPVWGGGADYLIALLWGLGLHQVSGSAFEGVAGLRDRIAR